MESLQRLDILTFIPVQAAEKFKCTAMTSGNLAAEHLYLQCQAQFRLWQVQLTIFSRRDRLPRSKQHLALVCFSVAVTNIMTKRRFRGRRG